MKENRPRRRVISSNPRLIERGNLDVRMSTETCAFFSVVRGQPKQIIRTMKRPVSSYVLLMGALKRYLPPMFAVLRNIPITRKAVPNMIIYRFKTLSFFSIASIILNINFLQGKEIDQKAHGFGK